MSEKPFINAASAVVYISAVVSLIFYGPHFIQPVDNLIIIPIAMLSLFVLSAAVMGYLFVYRPLLLFFEGKKKEATMLFVRTTGIFACFTLAMLLILYFIAR